MSVPTGAGNYPPGVTDNDPHFDDYNDDYDDEIELDEYEAFDCHMDRSGHCGAAGSEDCEFECPYRRDQYARERARSKAKSKGDDRG